MDHTLAVRIAKIVALLGFLLPWVTVSCSGQEIATLSGLGAAMGKVDGPNGQSESIGLQFLIIVALLATIGGAAASFMVKDAKQRMRIVLATSAAAFVSALVGMMMLKDAPRRQAVQGAEQAYGQQQSGEFGAMMNSAGAAIKVEEQFGYYLTLLALLAAAGASGMALTGRALPNVPNLSAVGGAMESLLKSGDNDVSDWDRITDKENPDQLQEYLLRHPSGRFAELARTKLQRLGITPLTPPAPPPS